MVERPARDIEKKTDGRGGQAKAERQTNRRASVTHLLDDRANQIKQARRQTPKQFKKKTKQNKMD